MKTSGTLMVSELSLPTLEGAQEFRDFFQKSIGVYVRESSASQRVLKELDRTCDLLDEVDKDRLVVGMLGGTGVGKSTLLNALAGETISTAGDRRPTTDRIVYYGHREYPIPSWLPKESVSSKNTVHKSEALKGVLVLDLPDIDSRRLEHRSRVHRVLPRLDVLLVVTSVDKYADLALFEELKALPQAPANLIFLLNAIDHLTRDELGQVLEDFERKITEQLGVDPEILPISALLGVNAPAAESQHRLGPLRGKLESLGGEAERRQVLLRNVSEQLQRSSHRLEEFLRPALTRDWIASFEELLKPLGAPPESTEIAFVESLEESLGAWLSDQALRHSSFPIGWIHFLVNRYIPGRKRGGVRDPFTITTDPSRPYQEECLLRPLRVREKRLRRLMSEVPFDSAYILETDPVDAKLPAETTLAAWQQQLRKRAPKLGWRLRHHIAPLFMAVATVLWAAAPLFENQSLDVTQFFHSFMALLARFSPVQWTLVLICLGIYYALQYPYLLYTLEGRIRREAQRGYQEYLKTWQLKFDEEWKSPLEDQLEEFESWWNRVEEFESLYARETESVSI